jgi:hypothetical protein
MKGRNLSEWEKFQEVNSKAWETAAPNQLALQLI